MTDRPIAAVLAVVAAAVFLAAFSAAAVLRPDAAAVAEDATPSSPASATEEMDFATIAAPSLSRVVPLPALHLPKAKPHKRKPTKQAKKPAAPRSTYTPPAPTATAAPRAPTYTPPPANPAPKRKSSSSGRTFDTSG
jgi:hypothetical protein